MSNATVSAMPSCVQCAREVRCATAPTVGHAKFKGPEGSGAAISHNLPAVRHRQLLIYPHSGTLPLLLYGVLHPLPVFIPDCLFCTLGCVNQDFVLVATSWHAMSRASIEPAATQQHDIAQIVCTPSTPNI